MAPLIKRFAESINSYAKQSLSEKHKESVNTEAETEYFGSTNKQALTETNSKTIKYSIKTPEDVLKHCQKFSNPVMGALHYIKNIALLPVLGVFRLFSSANSNRYGGSSSSYLRDANIRANVDQVTAYLASPINYKNFSYDNVTTNGKIRQERDLLVDGKKYKGKTVCETTEIAIYHTQEGHLIGVERGALFNQLKDGVMLYEKPSTKEEHKVQFAKFTETYEKYRQFSDSSIKLNPNKMSDSSHQKIIKNYTAKFVDKFNDAFEKSKKIFMEKFPEVKDIDFSDNNQVNSFKKEMRGEEYTNRLKEFTDSTEYQELAAVLGGDTGTTLGTQATLTIKKDDLPKFFKHVEELKAGKEEYGVKNDKNGNPNCYTNVLEVVYTDTQGIEQSYDPTDANARNLNILGITGIDSGGTFYTLSKLKEFGSNSESVKNKIEENKDLAIKEIFPAYVKNKDLREELIKGFTDSPIKFVDELPREGATIEKNSNLSSLVLYNKLDKNNCQPVKIKFGKQEYDELKRIIKSSMKFANLSQNTHNLKELLDSGWQYKFKDTEHCTIEIFPTYAKAGKTIATNNGGDATLKMTLPDGTIKYFNFDAPTQNSSYKLHGLGMSQNLSSNDPLAKIDARLRHNVVISYIINQLTNTNNGTNIETISSGEADVYSERDEKKEWKIKEKKIEYPVVEVTIPSRDANKDVEIKIRGDCNIMLVDKQHNNMPPIYLSAGMTAIKEDPYHSIDEIERCYTEASNKLTLELIESKLTSVSNKYNDRQKSYSSPSGANVNVTVTFAEWKKIKDKYDIYMVSDGVTDNQELEQAIISNKFDCINSKSFDAIHQASRKAIETNKLRENARNKWLETGSKEDETAMNEIYYCKPDDISFCKIE